ncbi:MAG: hydrogenase formation protein HypD [Candidatus Lokiarchaeota archaeon]|nr:hydrogenase formation protein HypD [Candidatus Lokiarchaeota archaeon]MBD3201912.1 hydrogenase formation protein HypD [Candidatus Lokiarchaeota archaeon]
MDIPGSEILKSKKFTEKLIKNIKANLDAIAKKVKLMHVCGTHEHTISKYGLRSLLPEGIEIVSGPGCPVCVCPAADIDKAIELGKRKDTVITTFGDMIRVPASNISLSELKAEGSDIRIVYGPNDAVKIAKQNPNKEVIFFAIGFETTVPLIGYELKTNPPSNFSVICAHKLIPAALELLISIDRLNIDGFISPGHVATIIGLKPFELFSKSYRVPNVVAGFEPNDVLLGILMLLKQIKSKKYETINEYSRVVKSEGNEVAQNVISEVFKSTVSPWRGIGRILDGGLAIKEKYAEFDADKKFDIEINDAQDIPPGCSCHLVMTGKIYPNECKLFRKTCTPINPIGPCMVSQEGTCSIYYKYHSD